MKKETKQDKNCLVLFPSSWSVYYISFYLLSKFNLEYFEYNIYLVVSSCLNKYIPFNIFFLEDVCKINISTWSV